MHPVYPRSDWVMHPRSEWVMFEARPLSCYGDALQKTSNGTGRVIPHNFSPLTILFKRRIVTQVNKRLPCRAVYKRTWVCKKKLGGLYWLTAHQLYRDWSMKKVGLIWSSTENVAFKCPVYPFRKFQLATPLEFGKHPLPASLWKAPRSISSFYNVIQVSGHEVCLRRFFESNGRSKYCRRLLTLKKTLLGVFKVFWN